MRRYSGINDTYGRTPKRVRARRRGRKAMRQELNLELKRRIEFDAK